MPLILPLLWTLVRWYQGKCASGMKKQILVFLLSLGNPEEQLLRCSATPFLETRSKSILSVLPRLSPIALYQMHNYLSTRVITTFGCWDLRERYSDLMLFYSSSNLQNGAWLRHRLLYMGAQQCLGLAN